jgi:tetratricopeptide (TPR) repeat protein
LADLDYAFNSLPVNWASSDYGRATKGAAYALRGKVYLYNQQYDKAITDFEEIVYDNSGAGYGYKLYDNYADLFTQKGDASDEMIFAIQTYNSIGENYGMPYAFYMGSKAAYGPGWNVAMPDVNLVDSYELKDGHTFNWDDYFPGYNEDVNIRKEVFMSTLTSDKKLVESYPKYHQELLEMYEDRDPRMKETIILPYTKYNGWVGAKTKECELVYANGVSTTNGFVVLDTYGNYNTLLYLFRKFVPEGDMDGQISSRTAVPINFPIIRYADVLLMLAECYNEQGNIDEAVKFINMVRQRPSTNLPPINNGQSWMEARTKEQVFNRLMHERAVEFAAEGIRYYDLIRWKKMELVMNSPEVDILGTKLFDNVFNSSRDYLWPIPGTEIDTNNDLTQNPGWQ